jgi:hypothetical protein
MSIQPEHTPPVQRFTSARRIGQWIVIALAMMASGAAAYQLGAGQSGRNSTAPVESEIDGLFVEPATLDLGEVWEAKRHVIPIPIRNRTSVDIRIDELSASCNCAGVSPRAFVIPAGQTVTVEVAIDLTHRMPWEVGRANRPLTIELRPVCASRPSAKQWVIRGTVLSRVTLNQLELAFGDSNTHGQPPMPRRLAGTAHVPAAFLTARVEPPVVDVRIEPPGEGDGRFTLVVTPDTRQPAGGFKGTLYVGVATPHGEHLPGTEIPIDGVLKPGGWTLPGRAYLPVTRVGQAAVTDLELRGLRPWAGRIERIETGSGDVTVETINPEEGGPPRLRVSFPVAKVGENERTVRVHLQDARGGLLPASECVISVYGE